MIIIRTLFYYNSKPPLVACLIPRFIIYIIETTEDKPNVLVSVNDFNDIRRTETLEEYAARKKDTFQDLLNRHQNVLDDIQGKYKVDGARWEHFLNVDNVITIHDRVVEKGEWVNKKLAVL